MDEKELFSFNLMGAIYENSAQIKACSGNSKVIPLMRIECNFSNEELKELCKYASSDETLIEELEELVERKVRSCIVQAQCDNGYADISLVLT